MNAKIKVLVVDDSAMVRKMICESLAKDPQIEVVGTAPDPYIARDKILELNPDVLTLDIEMPRMDGLTFLKILQQHRPIPVIIISSLTQTGSSAAMEALACGAVDVLAKPSSAYSIGHLGEQLAQRIKTAATAKMFKRPAAPAVAAAVPAPLVPKVTCAWHPRQIITIGSSTGGVEALTAVLPRLPENLPGIAIVQHIPPYYSKAFADRLSGQCAFEVREAVNGDLLTPNLALIAPGDFHMTLSWAGNGYRVALNQNSPVHHCRPAVDVLFRSVAECSGARITSVILTGMGCDGALGMKAQKAVGARTIAQDQATSVVYGMPRAAAELGVVDQVLPLPKIADAIVQTSVRLAVTAAPLNHPETVLH
jgi:two-component system chemotaxis response regulator CheB